ncbi:hypothetical protein AB0B28_17565 [Glycomyces sp. NPDC046736]|uniref:hypothetical protein n=1 Tax=Glycomyces sp. NPDC046736 TaxID=3155615 RepID=UPI0033F85BC4
MIKRIIQSLALLTAMVGMSFALSAPAQAADPVEATPAEVTASVTADGDVQPMTAAQCRSYIKSKGYAVGPLVTSACNLGVSSYSNCVSYFQRNTDVWLSHAQSACSLAGVV